MERRHWATARQALERIPVADGDVVLDLGCGSGYAARALLARGADRAYGVDASGRMLREARSHARATGERASETQSGESVADSRTGAHVAGPATADFPAFLRADFESLPLATDAIDRCFSMEAFYYARDPVAALRELVRVIRPGGTFYCAVDYWQEHHHSHDWAEAVDAPMTRWSEATYRERFADAGFHVASQDRIPDRDVEIPDADAFPTDDWETREAMIERYREYGTLLTVGVVP